MLDILIVLTITILLLVISPIIAIRSVYKAHKKKQGN